MSDRLLIGYVLAFAVAAAICFISIRRANDIADTDTRWGLQSLLALTGAWSATHVAYLLAPARDLAIAMYLGGLLFGIAAVGAWLYFCSAYSGRTYHRQPAVRRAAIGVFVVIAGIKLTNPLHGQYFTSERVTDPFVHQAIELGTLHWLTMGLSYALAAVGIFILLEVFIHVRHDTSPFVILIGITVTPVTFYLLSQRSPLLIDITYEPLGVAVFAIGVLYLYLDRFQTIKLAGERREPVIVLAEDGTIRDVNDAALAQFDRLGEAAIHGREIEEVLPGLDAVIGRDEDIYTISDGDRTRYYRITVEPLGGLAATAGTRVVLTDVTDEETYRRELERQNERLAQFASMVSHDLRNPLTVAKGHIELAAEEDTTDHIDAVADALDRMEALIDDVLALARTGQPIGETDPVNVATVANEAWTTVETASADLVVEGDVTVRADRSRLLQLFENLFRNAIDHAGDDVTVTVTGEADGRVTIADTGPGIPPEEREAVFEAGHSTREDGTGFGLAIVQEIVNAHGWEIRVEASEDGGAAFVIEGMSPLDE